MVVKRHESPIWILFIVLMNILYIGINGVHSMELIYYIMKLEFVALGNWAGERILNLGGPRGDLHSDRLYCHQPSEVRVSIPSGATMQLWSPQIHVYFILVYSLDSIYASNNNI